jgi:hypothetical protein
LLELFIESSFVVKYRAGLVLFPFHQQAYGQWSSAQESELNFVQRTDEDSNGADLGLPGPISILAG